LRFAGQDRRSHDAGAEIEATDVQRTPTGHDELDRVLGGGIVEGGVVLIGGDPGIGKSTLLLQALDSLQRSGMKTLVRHWRRKRRPGGAALAPAGAATIRKCRCWPRSSWKKSSPHWTTRQPGIAVIDSIQTVYSDQLTSAPGSVAQVRECAAHLTRAAKASGTAIVLVGHVTKEGRWPGRACWSTWWTRCCISRATRIPASA
jgi:DNA repair protein RadA/Sms